MRSESVLPGCSVAVTSLELQAFHCSLPTFHAFTAGPLSVFYTPSPLCLASPAQAHTYTHTYIIKVTTYSSSCMMQYAATAELNCTLYGSDYAFCVANHMLKEPKSVFVK